MWTTVGLLGFDGGQLGDKVDLSIVIRSDNYQHIEDVHGIIMHVVTDRLIDAIAEKGALDRGSVRLHCARFWGHQACGGAR